MKYGLFLLLLLNSTLGFAQTRMYRGFIGEQPIQFTSNSYSDDFSNAVYEYDEFDQAIKLIGEVKKGILTLVEKDEAGEVKARFEFKAADLKAELLSGVWINEKDQSKLKVRLSKSREFESYDEEEFENLELMQSSSTSSHYFRLLISKKAGADTEVKGFRIYQKESDQLLQEIKLGGTLIGLSNISVGDFNFDGIEDVSVFEESFAGPNTSSAYVLWNPASEEYFISAIKGISLEFDAEAKRVYETNQCCGGQSITKTTYKIVENKMVFIEKECREFDEESQDYMEVDCE